MWHRNLFGRKKPKTLSGIEARITRNSAHRKSAGKNLKPYQGLKPNILISSTIVNSRRKKPKTLSGIETEARAAITIRFFGRKKPKTLSGIETGGLYHVDVNTHGAGKNLKPYQGLKRFFKNARRAIIIKPEKT